MDEFSVIAQLSRQSVQIENLASSISKVEFSINVGINKLNDNLEEILNTQREHGERIKTLEVSEVRRKNSIKWLLGVAGTVVAGLLVFLIKQHLGG